MLALHISKYSSEALMQWSKCLESLNHNSTVSEMLNFFLIGKIKSDSFKIGSTALIDWTEYLAQNDYGKIFYRGSWMGWKLIWRKGEGELLKRNYSAKEAVYPWNLR